MTWYDLSLTQIGLGFDVAGVVVLGRALFLSSVRDIAAQAGTYYNANPHLREELCKQRVDARFGVPLLFFGFLIQFLGSYDNLHRTIWNWIAFVALIIALIVYFLFRRALVVSMIGRVKKKEAD